MSKNDYMCLTYYKRELVEISRWFYFFWSKQVSLFSLNRWGVFSQSEWVSSFWSQQVSFFSLNMWIFSLNRWVFSVWTGEVFSVWTVDFFFSLQQVIFSVRIGEIFFPSVWTGQVFFSLNRRVFWYCSWVLLMVPGVVCSEAAAECGGLAGMFGQGKNMLDH